MTGIARVCTRLTYERAIKIPTYDIKILVSKKNTTARDMLIALALLDAYRET